MSAISGSNVQALRATVGDVETRTLIVQIDAKQYKAALEAIRYWTDSESFEVPADTVNVDMTHKIVNTIGLKAPYRSRRTDSMQYHEDLWKLNREKE